MRYITCILILVGLIGCSTTKEYKLYRGDKSINYPEEKLTLKIVDDSTGLFTNSDQGRETLNQKFFYTKADKFLVIDDVIPKSQNLISLKQGDTVIVHKNRLLFFYEGDKKYLLYFKKTF